MRLAPLAALLIAAGAPCYAQAPSPRVSVREAGPGRPGRIVAAALAGVHAVIPPPPPGTPWRDSATVLRRDTTYRATVLVLGHSAAVGSTVHGDVIVVGGDLFLRPGARIDGRAVAIGGGVYNSLLATVGGSRLSFRDETFDVVPVAGGYALDYRVVRGPPSPMLALTGIVGLRPPTYDRSDGLSLPWGPAVSLDSGRIALEPTVTYRSQLGSIDPSVAGRAQLGRRTRIEGVAGRGTFSNDSWIWSDLVNSAAVLAMGLDTRNYFRAWRADARALRLYEGARSSVEPYLGARVESDRSVRPDSSARGGPWSLLERHDRQKMLRPNPRVVDGGIVSLLAGTALEWTEAGVTAHLSVDGEMALSAPDDQRFVQGTADGLVGFPTFRDQSLTINAHMVLTGGGAAPPQRWAYLGGSGTIPTLPLLVMGGDELLFLSSDYAIPISGVDLPLVGQPIVTLRHLVGGAGVRRLPDLSQNVGVRLTLGFVRGELLADPARRTVHVSAGLSVAR